ncbi:MAG TPA: hypothetical protein VGN46_11665 [Luteibacter sp.]|jgi:hypothetical protein|uniref:hypothetical protein n=1 Tax=Luteibacter sp. TaxID=1886636 RepID=UPI002F3EBFB6
MNDSDRGYSASIDGIGPVKRAGVVAVQRVFDGPCEYIVVVFLSGECVVAPYSEERDGALAELGCKPVKIHLQRRPPSSASAERVIARSPPVVVMKASDASGTEMLIVVQAPITGVTVNNVDAAESLSEDIVVVNVRDWSNKAVPVGENSVALDSAGLENKSASTHLK